MCKCWFLSCI